MCIKIDFTCCSWFEGGSSTSTCCAPYGALERRGVGGYTGPHKPEMKLLVSSVQVCMKQT